MKKHHFEMKKNIRTIIFLLLTSAHVALAQKVIDTIAIKDPSFTQQTTFWTDCGYDELRAGLTMGHGTQVYKTIKQELSQPLLKDKCYSFSLTLKQSQKGHTGMEFPNIRIWGGKKLCQRSELLAKTTPIAYMNGKTYVFKLNPSQDYQYLIIEAYTKPHFTAKKDYFSHVKKKTYAGHIIIDKASDIYEILCDDDPATNKLAKTEKTIMPELNKKISKGQVLRIRNLGFAANSAQISEGSKLVLDELYQFLSENPSVNIEVGGHTNNRCDTPFCNSLSGKRAKSVADFLVNKGIKSERITHKGYGKTDPVATNSTPEGRQSNQRVEIKVLTIN